MSRLHGISELELTSDSTQFSRPVCSEHQGHFQSLCHKAKRPPSWRSPRVLHLPMYKRTTVHGVHLQERHSGLKATVVKNRPETNFLSFPWPRFVTRHSPILPSRFSASWSTTSRQALDSSIGYQSAQIVSITDSWQPPGQRAFNSPSSALSNILNTATPARFCRDVHPRPSPSGSARSPPPLLRRTASPRLQDGHRCAGRRA